jgi:DNA replication and repair protein RecF
MKLAQALYLSNQLTPSERGKGGVPILLLDDIFDRLDSERVERIVKMVQGEDFGQIFITDTDRQHMTDILRPNENAKIFHVENGQIS